MSSTIKYISTTQSSDLNKKVGAVSFFSSDFKDINQSMVSVQRRYDRSRVRRFLTNPIGNVNQLQEISRYLMSSSGNYFRIIEYFSGMLTLYHYVAPSMSLDDMGEDVLDDYFQAAEDVKKVNIKRNIRFFINQLLILGEVYLYEIETDKGIHYVQIPNEWCRVSAVENGVYRFDVNVSGLRDTDLEYMPKEIAQLLGKNSKDGSGWHRISEKGFCFNIFEGQPKGFPLLLFMFDDIMGLEDTKDIMDNKTKVDAVKLIHQKIPLNDKDVPIFDMNIARIYHEATKRNLPDGVAVTTNPLDMSNVSFDKAQSQEKDIIERAERNLWNSVGISDLLFSSNKSGGEVMKMSVIADEILMFSILPQIEAYVQSKISVDNMRFSFLETTYFNKKEEIRMSQEALAFGASRIKYLATLGYEPHEIYSMLVFEQQVMDIDSVMLAKQASHTLSGKDDGGRPTNDSKGIDDSDNTDKAQERE